MKHICYSVSESKLKLVFGSKTYEGMDLANGVGKDCILQLAFLNSLILLDFELAKEIKSTCLVFPMIVGIKIAKID